MHKPHTVKKRGGHADYSQLRLIASKQNDANGPGHWLRFCGKLNGLECLFSIYYFKLNRAFVAVMLVSFVFLVSFVSLVLPELFVSFVLLSLPKNTMAHFILFLNFKGGTGKTTSAFNIAAALAGVGRRVLMVDLDAQHNLTQSAGVEQPERTVYDALKNKKPLPVVELLPGLCIAPNGLEMVKLEMELAAEVRREYRLREAIKPHLSKFDYFIFDCPPSLGLTTANALFAADAVAVFVPVEAEFLALKGFSILNEALQNLDMEISRVFVTKYDGRKVLGRSVLDAMKKAMPGKMFETVIRENVAVAEAPAAGLDIFRHAPQSAGAADYAALTAEIIQHFEK